MKFTKSEVEFILEGISRKIKELQAETLKQHPEVIKEAIQEYLTKLHNNYNELSKMKSE